MTAEEVATIRARISALLDLGRTDEVVALARRGLALDPHDAWLHAQLALALAASDPREAERAVAAAMAEGPDDPFVVRAAGRVILEVGKPKRARPLAERAAELAPWDPNTHLLLAHVYDAVGLPTKAAAAIDEVVRLAPDSPAGFVERSRLSLTLRDWATAERWARKALEIDASNSAALNNLAVALRQQGQHARALELFARAAAEEPRNGTAAKNARDTASGMGGMVIGGFTTYLVIRAIIVAARGSPAVALGLIAVLLLVVAVLTRSRFEQQLLHLPAHLQAFAREQRGTFRLRDPGSWVGRTRSQRRNRIAVAVLIVVLIIAVIAET